jgi:hypothetical protein
MSYKHEFLALKFSDLQNFFNPIEPPKKCHKVVFRFVYDNAKQIVLLEAFGAKNSDKKFILPPVPLQDLGFGITLAPEGKLYVSDLELSKKMYDEELGAPGAGDTHLLFYPVISAKHPNSVTYLVEWGKTAGLVQPPAAFTGQELNPSPPADPAP